MSKKKEEEKKRPLLGRPSNNVKIGIVGMPNVGKSTLFNIMCKMNVPAENYPFCTIDPAVARVPVPDARFDFLVESYKPKSVVPAVLTVTDIAGLVKGAHEGHGLGNAFLSHINATDGIFHLTRAFDDKDIEHVEGDVDPVRDLKIIADELMFKDIAFLRERVDSMEKVVAKGQDKSKKEDLDMLRKFLECVEQGKWIRMADWTPKEVELLNTLQLLTAKPVVYLVNMSRKDFMRLKNKWLSKITDWVKENDPGAPIIPFSATLEKEVTEMEPETCQKFLEEHKIKSMLPKIITTGYHALELIYFFTVGPDEVKAWTVRKGRLAPQAAGVIHTDFERGFICAEVMTFDDFKELKSEAAVRAAGKYRMQGKQYEVADGDIILFKFNVSGGAKKK